MEQIHQYPNELRLSRQEPLECQPRQQDLVSIINNNLKPTYNLSAEEALLSTHPQRTLGLLRGDQRLVQFCTGQALQIVDYALWKEGHIPAFLRVRLLEWC